MKEVIERNQPFVKVTAITYFNLNIKDRQEASLFKF